ncbi:AAA family ATPase [Plantactinospora sp. GCM10030261]|uniref:AAA family ATPase n=1 Tax=Plantactinospora sp. GCM10030261 TaxID=3273420 RepID=UPI00361354B3
MTPPSAPPPFVVVTGGPGAGKSTLLEALATAGCATVAEAGRAIIQDQTLIGGRALHTADTVLYAELMLSWEMRSHREAAALPGPVFFDRGVPDLVGYHLLLGRDVPEHVTTAARLFRYQPVVFVAPPWPDIYAHDEERKQDFAEAVRTHDAVVEGYRRHGYDLVALPKADVAARVDFVLDRLGG